MVLFVPETSFPDESRTLSESPPFPEKTDPEAAAKREQIPKQRDQDGLCKDFKKKQGIENGFCQVSKSDEPGGDPIHGGHPERRYLSG